MKKLLITDLDNTLYDWVSFYAQSFTAMLDELVVILGVPANVLIDEFSRSI
jgi:phosphoglycolate phosphatase